MIALLGSIAAEAIKAGAGFFRGKRKIQEAKVKTAQKIAVADGEYDLKALEVSENSWKDEWWTVVLSLPLIMLGYGVFAGDMEIVDRVSQMFIIMSDLPEWYQYALYGAIGGSFGLKGLVKFLNKK